MPLDGTSSPRYYGWTDESMALLRKLCASPDRPSAEKMADAISLAFPGIGLLTRNAVIGKCHRLGIPLPGTNRLRADKIARARAARKASQTKPIVARAKSPRIFVPEPDFASIPDDVWAPLPTSMPVPLSEVLPGDCRWPLTVAGEFRFCAAPAIVGKSYCKAHLHLSVGAGTLSERRACDF